MINNVKCSILISVLAISLLGVGFSSWIVFDNDESRNSVSIDIGNTEIIDLKDHLEFEPLDMFDYCESGVVVDETIVFSGDIKVSFKLTNVHDIYNTIEDKTKFSLSFYLSSSGPLNLIQYMDATNIKYSSDTNKYITPNATLSNVSKPQDNKSVSYVAEYSNQNLTIVDNIYFSFLYHFNFESAKSTFLDTIYTPLSTKMCSLDLNIFLV